MIILIILTPQIGAYSCRIYTLFSFHVPLSLPFDSPEFRKTPTLLETASAETFVVSTLAYNPLYPGYLGCISPVWRYLEGHADALRRLMLGLVGVIIWLTGVMSVLAESP